jgi:hypothetical protein
MSTTNTKIWFLLLSAGALFCAGCANVEQTQLAEMQQARTLVSQSGQALTAQQAEAMTLVLYNQMEQARVQRQIAAAQMISQGFSNAGEQISRSQTPIPQFAPLPPLPQQQIGGHNYLVTPTTIPTSGPMQSYVIQGY